MSANTMRLLCQCRVPRTGRGLIRQHCDESHHQGGQASNQVCTRTPNRRRRQHRTAHLEDTQVSGIVGHDAAADTSLAPLPGRARHTHSGIEGCWHRLGSLCHEDAAGFEVAWVGEAVGASAQHLEQLLVPSILPLEARSVWCQLRISSDHAMNVSTVLWYSGSSPVS